MRKTKFFPAVIEKGKKQPDVVSCSRAHRCVLTQRQRGKASATSLEGAMERVQGIFKAVGSPLCNRKEDTSRMLMFSRTKAGWDKTKAPSLTCWVRAEMFDQKHYQSAAELSGGRVVIWARFAATGSVLEFTKM